MSNKGLGIIFHSGSFDRLYHGISVALAALAMGWETKFFFTYWSLEYLKKGSNVSLKLDSEGEDNRGILEKNIKMGHMMNISELLGQAKEMGAKFYVCTNSMGLLNIARDELVEEVDKSMGVTTFLTETAGYTMLFI